jgi:hypothetical protein
VNHTLWHFRGAIPMLLRRHPGLFALYQQRSTQT